MPRSFSARTMALRSSPPSRVTATGNPNQLGSLLGVASGSSKRSCRSDSPSYRWLKLRVRASMKPSSFLSCATPTAACMSVTFRFYPMCEYTYLWS